MSDRQAIAFPGPEVSASFGRIVAVLVMALSAAGIGLVTGLQDFTGRAFLAAGLTLAAVSAVAFAQEAYRRRRRFKGMTSFRSAIESDPVPVLMTDHDGVVRIRNAAARELFGTGETGEETLGTLLRGSIADPLPVLRRLTNKALARGSATEDIVTRGGHLSLTAYQSGFGALTWRVEHSRKTSLAESSAARLPIPVLSAGRGGTILFMNEAARAMVGGRVRTLDRLFVSPLPEDGGICRISTGTGPVRAAVSRFGRSGGRQEIFLLPLDAEDDRDGAGIANLPVAVLCVDLAGKIRDINPMAIDLLGGAVGVGDDFSQALNGLAVPLVEWLRDTADIPAARRTEFVRLSRKDKQAFVQMSLARIRDKEEDLVIAVLHDATELKTLEAQFVQGQKMQAIGQLAGGVAHDFNNLLTAISGHCDLLMLRHDQGDPDFGDLDQIHQNANRAAALVGQLLAFSRKQTLRTETLDLRDTLADLAHLLNRLVGEKVTLTLSHDPVLPPVRADKRQLEQVIMNLVVNARDAMPEGGEIRIQTEAVTLSEPLIRDRATVRTGAYVLVKVSDQGTGISPDNREKIFEPFYTTKRSGEGTGLGLSTVYGIIKQMNGFIFVDSALGQGTEFTIYLPANDGTDEFEAPANEPEPEIALPAQNGEGVVLLVEDEAPVRAFASRALRLRGFSVLEAGSAEEALEILSDDSLHVDVFLTDVVMPGKDGPGWVREALQKRPDARVIFVSGYTEGAFGEAEARIPNSIFLPKPFSLNQLTETVRRHIG